MLWKKRAIGWTQGSHAESEGGIGTIDLALWHRVQPRDAGREVQDAHQLVIEEFGSIDLTQRSGHMHLQGSTSKQQTGSGDHSSDGTLGVTTKSTTTSSGLTGWQGVKITKNNLKKMLEAQGFKCALTGRELTPETASLDHIVPLNAGGAHDMSNVHIVHAEINAMKGTLTLDTFTAACVDVAIHSGMLG